MTSVILKMCDGVSVVVPDSLDLITTYILREQIDWFEDEIKFVRHLLKPGQQAIDIGANFGLYTLSMARVVGPHGHVWAFEPASTTAAFLSRSIQDNRFVQITLDKHALSDRVDIARLSLNEHSELNELVRPGESDLVGGGNSESVALTTLDTAMDTYGWRDIDFVKIDAEGEEAAIIRGGQRFFKSCSPLVQYEIKAVDAIHFELINIFRSLGYASYRLVPGLGVLVPFEPGSDADPYLLNLFCCKADRAETLVQAGLMIQGDHLQTERADSSVSTLLGEQVYNWDRVLTGLPYGGQLAEQWRQTVELGHSSDIERALKLHAIAHDFGLALPVRVSALRSSLAILQAQCQLNPGYLRYASLARVAIEYGSRHVAVNALRQLSSLGLKHLNINPAEPFLATSQYFEQVDPGASVGNWLLCSALEVLELNEWYSSFYSGVAARNRLELIHKLGFGSPAMGRRLALLNQRYCQNTAAT